MSRFDVFPATCTISTPGPMSPAAPYTPASPIEVSYPCRLVHEQRRFDRADGQFENSSITLYLQASAVIPDKAIITVEGTPYHVLRQRDEVDAYGQIEGRTAWLG